MNCDDCRQRLQACLDGEPPAADGIAAHLAACPDCRALDAAAGRLRLGLLAAAAPVPPAGLAERIVVGVLADRRRQRARRRALFAGAGLAAAACLAVAFLLHKRAPGESAAARPTGNAIVAEGTGAMRGRRDKPAPEPPAAPPSLNENVAEATSAVASLARRTADQTLTSGQMFLPAVPMEVPPEQMLASPLDPPAQSLREAGQRVATGLGPVANSARRALDLFLRDMPPVAPDPKSGL